MWNMWRIISSWIYKKLSKCMFSVLTLNKWSDSRHRNTRNDFLMDTSPAWRIYIVNQLGEISISEALYPWIILIGKRRDLTITLWEWEVCYTVTHRQLNPTLSLIRRRCKNDVCLVDRITPSITIHGKDPIRLVLVEAIQQYQHCTKFTPVSISSIYLLHTRQKSVLKLRFWPNWYGSL
jgi:hypothetical protein